MSVRFTGRPITRLSGTGQPIVAEHEKLVRSEEQVIFSELRCRCVCSNELNQVIACFSASPVGRLPRDTQAAIQSLMKTFHPIFPAAQVGHRADR